MPMRGMGSWPQPSYLVRGRVIVRVRARVGVGVRAGVRVRVGVRVRGRVGVSRGRRGQVLHVADDIVGVGGVLRGIYRKLDRWIDG